MKTSECIGCGDGISTNEKSWIGVWDSPVGGISTQDI